MCFSEYFMDKVKLLRGEFDLQTAVSPIYDDPYSAAVFEAFQPVSEEHVRNVSAPKTCSLDPIPTSLYVECLDELLPPTVTHTINPSLVSGAFPPVFSTAIAKPLLKKPSLEARNSLKTLSLSLKFVI